MYAVCQTINSRGGNFHENADLATLVLAILLV